MEDKVAKFEELTKKEKDRMAELKEWFNKPENLPKIIGKNGFYDTNLDFGCGTLASNPHENGAG